MCRRRTRVSQPAAKPRLCPATPSTKEPFMRGDDVNSAISRGKEKRAERRLLPPAVASGGPSQMVLLTLSAEPKEKVGKKQPTSAAAGGRLDPGGVSALQDAMRRPVPSGAVGAGWQQVMCLPLSSNAGSNPVETRTTLPHPGWEGTTLSPAWPCKCPCKIKH